MVTYLEHMASNLFLTNKMEWLRCEYGSRFKFSEAVSRALCATFFKSKLMSRFSTPSIKIDCNANMEWINLMLVCSIHSWFKEIAASPRPFGKNLTNISIVSPKCLLSLEWFWVWNWNRARILGNVITLSLTGLTSRYLDRTNVLWMKCKFQHNVVDIPYSPIQCSWKGNQETDKKHTAIREILGNINAIFWHNWIFLLLQKRMLNSPLTEWTYTNCQIDKTLSVVMQ